MKADSGFGQEMTRRCGARGRWSGWWGASGREALFQPLDCGDRVLGTAMRGDEAAQRGDGDIVGL